MTVQSIDNVETALLNEITCALCQDIFDKPYALVPCLHTFCLECISHIPKQSQFYETISCPICRTRSHKQVANFTMQNFIDIYKTTDSYKEREPEPESFPIKIPHVSTEILETRVNPCRSCVPENSTGYQCPNPISDENQTDSGHLLCGYCSEYMPARGENGNTPAINQCCSFCGVVACDEYWGCRNTSPTASLHRLRELRFIPDLLQDIEAIETLEDGHLNPVEIEYLKAFLCRSGISWHQAWNVCLDDLDANHCTTAPIIQRMTSLAQEIYRTHRISHSDVEIRPSDELRACYSCLPGLVNGQFYAYWKKMIETNYSQCSKEQCPFGIKCQTQWRSEAHALRLSHIEFDFSNSNPE